MHLPDDIIEIDGKKPESIDRLLEYMPDENATPEEVIEALRQVNGVLYQVLVEIYAVRYQQDG
jgi:hypothetical protein